jgi:cytochrome c oxidase subunit 3
MNGDPYERFRSQEDGPREPSFRMSTQQFGVLLLLGAITMLFGATLAAYVITRSQVHAPWRADGSRDIPAGLGVSTLMLFGASVALQWAHSSIRQNKQDTLRRALWLGTFFAAAFLLAQAINWLEVSRVELVNGVPTLFAFTFYLLTGVHALHVIGGFIPLGIVLWRASQREYSSSRFEGVKLCVQYWHYLGVVWLVLLTTMYIAT